MLFRGILQQYVYSVAPGARLHLKSLCPERELSLLWTALAPTSAMAMLAYWMPAFNNHINCLGMLPGTVKGTLCPVEALMEALSCMAA